MEILDHERLDVYRVARELSREVHRILKKIRGRDREKLLDQAFRATSSIPLNIAEGSGERSAGRKTYFYRVARASATELSAALDHMVDLEMITEAETVTAKALIVRIVAMLVKMTASMNTPDSFPSLPRPRDPRRK